MILHFVGEQNSPYYKSDTFMELLRKVTQNPARFVLKHGEQRMPASTEERIHAKDEADQPINAFPYPFPRGLPSTHKQYR